MPTQVALEPIESACGRWATRRLDIVGRRRDPGTLEAEVLGVLSCSPEPLSPAGLRAELDSQIAYTTVTTVLARMLAKGLVRRTTAGRGFVYEPAVDEGDEVARRMRQDLRLAGDRTGALNSFVAQLDEEEAAALRRVLRKRSSR